MTDQIELLHAELAASQAREAQLRESLNRAVETTYSDTLFSEWKALLSLPTDDAALRARLKAERERCIDELLDLLPRELFCYAAKRIRSLGDQP